MYPAFNAVAILQEEKDAQRSTNWALQAEKVHAGMYERAKQAVDNKEDITLGTVYICEVCGFTVEGEVPNRCPICGAPKDKFRAF
jgi:rubrerythrin